MEKTTWNAKVSFPGFGTTAGTAAEGNDVRLSDARTPLAHNQAWSTITTTPTTLTGYGITDAQPLDADLTAFAGLSTTGLVARTGAGTAATRTITGTANQVIVANGDGVSGNPTLSLPQNIATTSTPTFANLSIPSGSVGVGTSSPQAHLHVGSAETDLATYGGELKVFTGANTSLESVGGIELPVATNGYGVKIQALSAAGPALAFANRNGVATWTERMRIDANGNVGINTASPSGILDVAKPSSGGRVQVVNEGADVYNAIASRNAADSAYLPLTARAGGFTFESGAAPVSISGATSGEGQVLQVLSTNSFGPGVGPFICLGGKYNTAGSVAQFGGILAAKENSTDGDAAGAMYLATRTNVGGLGIQVQIGSTGSLRLLAYGAGTLVTDSSGNVTASSDRRLKNVGAKFTRGLDDVLKIQPRFYTWKHESGMNPDDVNVGFIAQDVQDAIPEAVGTTKTNDMEEDDVVTGKKVKKSKREAAEFLTLSDRPIIAALVNAVKELKAENDELRKRLDKLETKK